MSVCEQGLVARLKADPQVAAIVGTRIYPGLINQQDIDADSESIKASIAYQVEEDEPVMSMAGAAGISKAIILLNCWGGPKPSDSTVAKSIQDAIRDSLSGYRGTVGSVGFRMIRLSDNGDLIYTAPGNAKMRAYGKQLEAEIFYNESVPSLG